MFTHFVCALLSFRVREFPEKSKIREPGKFIVERTSYASTSSAIMELRRLKKVSLKVIFIGYHRREKILGCKIMYNSERIIRPNKDF